MIYRYFAILSLVCLLQISCNRAEYFPDKPLAFTKTVFVAHQCAGYLGKANTLESAKLGLQKLQAIECDIQMSADGSLWLSHDPNTPTCGEVTESIFPELSDSQIMSLNSCLGNVNGYSSLESVFKFIADSMPQAIISLDVKAWVPKSIKNVNLILQMNSLAQKIIELTQAYNLENRVFVESEVGDFLYYIRTKSSGIETYLATYGDFELGVARALNGGFTGISFKYMHKETITKESIAAIRRKGLKIQLWTVNDTSYIKEALQLQVDYIQTDNINYVTTLNK